MEPFAAIPSVVFAAVTSSFNQILTATAHPEFLDEFFGDPANRLAGGIAGLFKAKKGQAEAKELGKALGHSVSQGFIDQAKDLAKQLGISLKEAAKKLEKENLLGKLGDLRSRASASAGQITGSLGGFGKIAGAAEFSQR